MHALVLGLIRWAGILPPAYALVRAMYACDDPRLAVEAFGVRFKNPVGLAAGYDKNGVAVRGLSALGFGHVEVGTVTRQAQAGNPRPRVHRVPEAGALINSMGFPNEGVDALRVRGSPLSSQGSAARRGSASTSARARTRRWKAPPRTTARCCARSTGRPTTSR